MLNPILIYGLIRKLIDFEDNNDLNFYSKILSLISDVFKDSNIAFFFIENSDIALVESNIPSWNFNKTKIQKLYNGLVSNPADFCVFEVSKDEFFKKNTLVCKLCVVDSMFGFCVLSSENDIKEDIISSFVTVCKVLSYKIKDFELSDVFKLQLRAMQDAIIEKEEAFALIKKQHKKLQELDKTKNLFLANISHELRTPLNAIIGFSQALDSKIFGELNQKQSEYIKDIQISGLHLLGMINEILDISKIESNAMKFCPVDLNPSLSINEVVNILSPLYQAKNIKLSFKDDFKGTIKADNQKFQQILYNLLSNAIKFTPENGKIDIRHFKDKNKYILKIKDTGIGIDKKYHSKIFKKFVHIQNSYANNYASTGLGLTITKELVKLHKGKITLESELNKGTCFTMEFDNIKNEK